MTRTNLLALVFFIGAGAALRATAADLTEPLPPLAYSGTIAGDELMKQLKSEKLFQNLNDELVGCPILLRVTHSMRPTAGGTAAGLASAIWSGGTLGLLPLVVNND